MAEEEASGAGGWLERGEESGEEGDGETVGERPEDRGEWREGGRSCQPADEKDGED